MRFDPGSVLIMDRGYIDYEWFVQLSQQAIYVVTRLKDRACFEIVEDRPLPAKGNILKDQIIFFHSQAQPSEEYFFRLVEVWLEDKQESVVLLTNNLEFAATTIAAIYKERRQVKLFFNAIKQNLKIKTSLGTSANAGKTQIWRALIAMLILKHLQLRSRFSWSLSNLIALLRHQLFVYRDLFARLGNPFEGPPALAGIEVKQLSLGLAP